jgi:hypothetical protein
MLCHNATAVNINKRLPIVKTKKKALLRTCPEKKKPCLIIEKIGTGVYLTIKTQYIKQRICQTLMRIDAFILQNITRSMRQGMNRKKYNKNYE